VNRRDRAIGFSGKDREQPVQSDIRRPDRTEIALPFAPGAGEEERHTVSTAEPESAEAPGRTTNFVGTADKRKRVGKAVGCGMVEDRGGALRPERDRQGTLSALP